MFVILFSFPRCNLAGSIASDLHGELEIGEMLPFWRNTEDILFDCTLRTWMDCLCCAADYNVRVEAHLVGVRLWVVFYEREHVAYYELGDFLVIHLLDFIAGSR